MTTYDQYLKGVLQQIDDSHRLISNLQDKPGDLEIIKKDLAKITGLLQAIANKIETNKQEFSDYQYMLSSIRFFLENHDFFKEINTMSLLYSDDPMRLKHLRLTILDALDEKNLIGHVRGVLKDTN
ncbi:MAG: hypothetical protein ACT4NT_01540 [Nitrososphaerota archaeon]